MKLYTGVGSRQTPPEILSLMVKIAQRLASTGWVLRSGGAIGADSAFERGAGRAKEIFYAADATPASVEIASTVHPAWHRCSDYARKLHGRNVMQVLGRDLKLPSKFVVCWTRDGLPVGGTATAIRLARKFDIPVFNLAVTADRQRIESWLERGCL